MADVRKSWPQKTEKKNEIYLEAVKAAFAAGHAAGFAILGDESTTDDVAAAMKEVDWWAFDKRDVEEGKKKKTPAKRGEKKPSPKKPEMNNDLAVAPYNPEWCKARAWNKKDDGTIGADQPGHGMQCWRPPTHDGYCEKCAERMSDPELDNWGDFDKPLTESPGSKVDGGSHPWAAMKEKKPKKKATPKKVLLSDESEDEMGETLDQDEAKAAKAAEKAAKAAEKEKKAAAKAAAKAAKKEAKAAKKEKAEVVEKAEEKAEVVEKAEEKPEEKEEVVEKAEEKEEVVEKAAEKAEVDEQATLELGSDDELGKDEPPEMVEYSHNGFTLTWNKKTNELIDPDDGEVMGAMVANSEGQWGPEMKGDDDAGATADDSSDDEDSDDSDDDDESEEK